MTAVEGPYQDTGTGAYPGPPAEVTREEDHDNQESTGAVDAPPAEVTVTSPAGEEVTVSTGAVEGPPAEQTSYQWPSTPPEEKKTGKKAVTADEAGVEDKSMKRSATKRA